MAEHIQKIIYLFGSLASRILVVSANHVDAGGCLEKYPRKLISFIDLEHDEDHGFSETQFEKRQYDLVILDRTRCETQKKPDEDRFLANIYRSLSEGGHIISITDNRLNLRKPGACIKSIIEFIFSGASSPFVKGYCRQLENAGISCVKPFLLIPDITNFNHVISDNREATLSFMRKSRGFTRGLPTQIGQWPTWILVWAGVDKWLVSNHLYWGQR